MGGADDPESGAVARGCQAARVAVSDDASAIGHEFRPQAAHTTACGVIVIADAMRLGQESLA